jgi:hypothetical protein
MVPFKPEHMSNLMLQPAQKFFQTRLTDEEFCADVSRSLYATTCMVNNAIVGCAGIYPQTNWLGLAWCLFDKVPATSWTAIVRQAKRGLKQAANDGLGRIEALVPVGFMPGARFAKMTGMEFEGLKRQFMPDGSNVWLFVRLG